MFPNRVFILLILLFSCFFPSRVSYACCIGTQLWCCSYTGYYCVVCNKHLMIHIRPTSTKEKQKVFHTYSVCMRRIQETCNKFSKTGILPKQASKLQRSITSQVLEDCGLHLKKPQHMENGPFTRMSAFILQLIMEK